MKATSNDAVNQLNNLVIQLKTLQQYVNDTVYQTDNMPQGGWVIKQMNTVMRIAKNLQEKLSKS